MYADLALENTAIKDVLSRQTLTPSAKREAIRIMTEEHGVPIVRACQAARLSRTAYYRPGMDRAVRDAEVINALQAIVVEEHRWGSGSATIDCGRKATVGITSVPGVCTATCG